MFTKSRRCGRHRVRTWALHNPRTLPARALPTLKRQPPAPEMDALSVSGAWDCVTPVPSRSPFAQALAEHLSRKYALPLKPLLTKNRPLAVARVPVVFRCRATHGLMRAQPAPARVLLVDDYITTGSTVLAAARALFRAGACTVGAIAWRLS
jgi:phosphoribosylpyrophosphate synthetase